eukprot:CAMPEP_0201484908 /NCGR_PEP_ID=MMETSP0151_2-20130828/9056_1 /ASSEMBLY_ACC=CAM_ASM_000257 /TAXON_ID=200890 /ORGANISM="Paramoeba atlantica, Strain 621/1 / CCAP 1560/9" /LENGTH=729 /DNA_ID=CAMNT_0047868783 /DNA_START=73 /DNA_END=2262 /DNA_ORIENTATION=+
MAEPESVTEGKKAWEARQRKIFSQWIGSVIKRKDFDLLDLSRKDPFFQLLEELLEEKLPFKWEGHVTKEKLNKLEGISYLQQAVDVLHSRRVALDVTGKNIYNGDLTLLMGMTWALILKYQVVDKKKLLKWCQTVCKKFELEVKNFTTSWVDGRCLGALVSYLDKDLIGSDAVLRMRPDTARENLTLALDKAEDLKIFRTLEPDDLLEGTVNERVVMLYLSYFYKLANGEADRDIDKINPEVEYLKSELETMVKKYRDLQVKYETLRLRSKEETEYLITSQQSLYRQLEQFQKDRKKMARKLKAIKEKMKLQNEEKSAKKFHVDPPAEGLVAIVTTGVQGSGKLWGELPNFMGPSTSLHNALMRNIGYEYGGYEMKCEGDSFTYVFDDVKAALEFAMKIQLMMREEGWPEELKDAADCQVVKNDQDLLIFAGLRVKIGVHAGESTRHQDQAMQRMNYFGPVLSRAQGLCKAAAGGQILMTMETWSMVLEKIQDSLFEPRALPLGEFNFSEIETVEEVGQLTPGLLAERYFPPILTDANLGQVAQVLADELNRLSDENKQLKNNICDMESKAEDARRRAALMQSWLESVSEGGDPSMTQDNEMLSITRDITNLSREKDELSIEIQRLKEENEQMGDYMGKLNKDLQEAKQLTFGLKDKIDYLKGETGAATETIKKLRTEVNHLKTKKIEDTVSDWVGNTKIEEEPQNPKVERRNSKKLNKMNSHSKSPRK